MATYRWPCVVFLGALAACGKSHASPTTSEPAVSGLSFGPVDASVQLDSNSTLLAEDYDSGSTALYKALAANSSSFVFSAYSVDTAVGMMYAGAQGNTVADIADALHWRLNPADLGPAHRTLTTVIATQAANSNTTLQTGTRMWLNTGLTTDPNYNAALTQNYGAAAQSLDLGDPTTASQTIDAWVAAQTDNLIPNLLAPSDLQNVVLVQTAAMHFKAAWETSLHADSSANTPFTGIDGTEQVAMLRDTGGYPYVETSTYQAVDIPYGNGAFAFLVVLPKGDISSFEASLSGAFVHQVVASMTSVQVQLAIPPLQMDVRPDLTQALKALGMTVAFSSAADFSGTGLQNINLQSVIGEVVLKLDQDGTEAAAATAVTVEPTDAPSNPTVFTADHPFFFAIHDRTTNVPLFSGRIGDVGQP